MNVQKQCPFLVRISFYFVLSIPLWSWAQTPFNFAEIQTSVTASQKAILPTKYPLIPLRRVYKGEQNRGVHYFSSFERKESKILIKDGLFYQAKHPQTLINHTYPPPLLLPNIIPPPPVDEAESMGYAIFAFDQDQNLYLTFKAQQSKIHHSSILAGSPVICAGEVQIFQGQLKYINNRSGHYQPPPKSLKILLNYLEKQGVDLKEVKVEYLGVDL